MEPVTLSIALSLVSGLISGVIASAAVAWWLNSRDKRQWARVRLHLVKQLRSTLNALLATLRIAVDVGPPDVDEIQSQDQLDMFIKAQLVDRFHAFEQSIMYMSADKQKTLFANFRNLQDVLRELGPMFISLKSADPWYAETVFELMNKMFSSTTLLFTFPEMGMEEHKDDARLMGGRRLVFNSMKALCEYAYVTKKSPLIRDVLGDSFE